MEEERSTDIELGLEDLLGILRQCWILMLVVAIVVGAGLYAFLNATHEDEYTATAIIHAGSATNSTSSSTVSSSDLNLAKELIEDCKFIITDWETANKVIQNRNMYIDDMDEFISDIQVSSKSGTRFISISFTAATAEDAAEIASELAEVTCAMMNEY